MSKPQILVLAGDEAADAIEMAGFSLAGQLDEACRTGAVIVDARGAAKDKSQSLAKSLKVALGPRAGLFFAWADPGAPLEMDGFDGVFTADTPTSFITTRLGSALRVAAMADEARLRFESLTAYGGASVPPVQQTDTPIRLLIYGEPGASFMAISKILDELNILTYSALTSFTAFDYLHDAKFDGVIMVTEDDRAGACAFASAMRRNTRLFHVPLLVVAGQDLEDTQSITERGASDVVYAGQDDEAAIFRLMSLAMEKKKRENLSLAFAAARAQRAMDDLTGLYGRDFCIDHANRLINRAHETDGTLILAIVKVDSGLMTSGIIDQASFLRIIAQAGAMLGKLVRAEDIAARLDDNHFAIILPNADIAAAKAATRRISAVLECTGFNAGSIEQAVTISTSVATQELGRNDDAKSLIARTFGLLPPE